MCNQSTPAHSESIVVTDLHVMASTGYERLSLTTYSILRGFGSEPDMYSHLLQKCEHSGFCMRLRGVQRETCSIASSSVAVKGSSVNALLVCGESKQELDLRLTAYDGIVRLHINEAKASGKKRFQVPHALLPDVDSKAISWGKNTKSSTSLLLTLGQADVSLQYSPLQLDVTIDGKPAISFNSKNLFNFEHLRQKQVSTNKVAVLQP